MNSWYAILAAIGGWAVAQITKVVISWVKNPKARNLKVVLEDLMRSGGMPSGHTATMLGITTYLGLASDFQSVEFALALVVTALIVYDATHVRYIVGEMGKKLNGLLAKGESLKIVEGHTVAQAIVGAMIGVGMGVLVYFLGNLA